MNSLDTNNNVTQYQNSYGEDFDPANAPKKTSPCLNQIVSNALNLNSNTSNYLSAYSDEFTEKSPPDKKIVSQAAPQIKTYENPIKVRHTLGKQEIEVQKYNEIGRGNYKKVNMATLKVSAEETQDVVFAKFINKTEDRFTQREKHILTKVNMEYPKGHRGLAHCLGICQWSKDSSLKKGFVFPYYNGRTLQNVLTVSKKESLTIALDIAYGLQALHKIGVLHNDLKPDNVCLQRDAITNEIIAAYVTDFGISTDMKDITESRVISANLSYSSPELLLETSAHTGNITEQSDIYSFGKILLSIIQSKKNSICNLMQEALDENPSSRPSLEKIIEALENLDNKNNNKLEVAN